LHLCDVDILSYAIFNLFVSILWLWYERLPFIVLSTSYIINFTIHSVLYFVAFGMTVPSRPLGCRSRPNLFPCQTLGKATWV